MREIRKMLTQYKGLRREIYVLCFGRVVTNLGSMVYPMLTLILSRKLGMSASAIAIFMVVVGVVMLPANLLGGRLADRYNKKFIIVLFDAISVFCYLACAAIPLSYVSIGLMLVAAIFQSMEWPSYNALIAELSTTKQRESAFSLAYLCANLGLVLSPTIAGLLFEHLLWLSFLISGVAIGLSTVLIFFLIRDVTPVEDHSEAAIYQQSRREAGLMKILRENRTVLLYVIAAAIYAAAYSQYNYLMPLSMSAIHGARGAVLFGTVSSLNCIVVVFFTPVITKLFSKFHEPARFLMGLLLILAGYGVFLALLGFIPSYYAAILLFTWGEIFVTTAEGPFLSTRIPASHRGRINSFSSVLGSITYSVLNVGVGQLYDHCGAAPAWIPVIGFLLLSILMAVILIRVDRVRYPMLYLPENPETPEQTN